MDKLSAQTNTSIKVFRFDPHPRRKQLTIVGESVITVARNGQIVKEVSEPFKKSVQLIGLVHNSRVSSVVKGIFQSCPFIENTPSLRSSLKETVEELANREYDVNGVAVATGRASDGSFLPRYLDVFDEVESSRSSSSQIIARTEKSDADIMKINQYVEQLYENETKKIEGLNLISQLTKYNRYLLVIAEHASALNAVIRTLREDRRKNMNLTHFIFKILLDFSKFSFFHRLMIRHKVHQLVLDKIDPELERYEKWKMQLQEKESFAQVDQSSDTVEDYLAASDNFQIRVQLQNKILQLGFTILHHLTEDRLVAKTLLHQGVITSLSDSLERIDFPLLESVLLFLKDISLYREFIEQMVHVGTLEKIVNILKGKVAIPVKVARACFGLLCNLSFHPMLRHDMISGGLLSVFSKCLIKSTLSDVITKTLYIISQDTLYRGKIVKSGIIGTLMEQLSQAAIDDKAFEQLPRIKAALVANLAKDVKGAKAIGESTRLCTILKHSIKTRDIVGMKIIRNIVETVPSKAVDQQAGHIAKAVVEVNSLDFVIECVGTLAHSDVNRVDFPDILKKNRLVIWLKRQLMNYMNTTNFVDISYQLKTAALEVVLLLSNICRKEEGARFIVGEGFVDQILLRLLNETHTDPQIVQQIVHLYNVCCSHAPVATFLVTKTQFPQELMAFALRIGGTLRAQCELTLHKLSEHSETWNETMMEHEFLMYNENWTTAVTEEFNKEEIEMPKLSPLKRKHSTATEYQILQDMIKGTRNPYKNFTMDDDDEAICTRPDSSADFTALDDSTTDDDSIFPSSSLDLPLRFLKGSSSKLCQMYLEEFGEDSNLSRDSSGRH